jgi:hypothetical protein
MRVKKSKQIKIKLNPQIYDYGCVLRTKKAFEKFCEISLDKTPENFIQITLKAKPKFKNIGTETFTYEFYNHLLNNIKETKTS